ncbi:MAG: type VI immunity family protein [Paracoccaceae bacterium]
MQQDENDLRELTMADGRFELREDGTVVTSHVFGMSFFLSGDVTDYAADLIAVQNGWLDLVGRSRFGWYATETMSKHRKANAKTLALLASWLAPDAPKRDYIAMMLKDGSEYDEPGAAIFRIFAHPAYDPAKSLPAYLHLAMPAGEAAERLEVLESVFVSVSGRLPVCSAQGGWGIETSPYFQEESHTAAWAFSMRHPGLDVFTGIDDRRAARLDGLRTVNWLTAIGSDLLADVGGSESLRKLLPSEVTMVPLPNGGLVLRAGPAPEIGDVNRRDRIPAYSAVNAALRPLIDRCVPRAMDFDIRNDDEGTATPRWFRRFAGPS